MGSSGSLKTPLARLIANSCAHAAILESGDVFLRNDLCKNPFISPQVWLRLFEYGVNLEVLCKRAQGDEQLEKIFSDKRVTVKRLGFYSGLSGCSDEMKIWASEQDWLSSEAAEVWLSVQGASLPEVALKNVLNAENGVRKLIQMARCELYSAEEVAGYILTLDKKTDGREISAIFEARGGVLESYLNSERIEDNWVFLAQVAASSNLRDSWSMHHLLELCLDNRMPGVISDGVLVNLSYNPNTPVEVLLEIAESKSDRRAVKKLKNELNQVILDRKAVGISTKSWDVETGPVYLSALEFAKRFKLGSYPKLTGEPNRSWLAFKHFSFFKPSLGVPDHRAEEIWLHEGCRALWEDEEFVYHVEQGCGSFDKDGWAVLLALLENWHGSAAELITSCKASL